uniref:transport and Golgi organization protein 6 homolog n=1 Tax=Myxine glutinosa TaxID=7769 RepID=UPI00358F0B16
MPACFSMQLAEQSLKEQESTFHRNAKCHHSATQWSEYCSPIWSGVAASHLSFQDFVESKALNIIGTSPDEAEVQARSAAFTSQDLTNWVVADVPEDDATSSKKDSTTTLGAVDDDREKQVLLLQLVSILCERLGHQALKDTAQIVEFVGLTLERGIISGEALHTESLKLAMGLLAALFTGEIELKSEDHAALKTLLPKLNELASTHSAPDVRELASDLCIALATHGVYTADSVTASAQSTLGRQAKVTPENWGSGHCAIQHDKKMESLTKSTEAASINLRQRRGKVGKESEQMSSGREISLQEVMEAAFDPDVPERAEALRTLTSLLKRRNLEALGLQDKILTIFLENMDHVDSFVYLSAIQGISILADICPERVLPQLLQEYGTCQPQRGLISQHPTISAPNLLAFPVGKDTSEGVGSHAAYRAERTTESRMKLGEALMRATRALGSLAPHYKDPLLHAFLQGTRDPEAVVRASSLSNLGELCQLLGFSLSSCIQELTACLDAVIKMDPDSQVRRAGVHVITLLLRGLGADATQVLAEVLRQLYGLLKHAASRDNDQVTALHARVALDELDQIMRGLLFPSDNLHKRIVILP